MAFWKGFYTGGIFIETFMVYCVGYQKIAEKGGFAALARRNRWFSVP